VKPAIYIETTVVSYLTAKPTRDLIVMARQQITMAWWKTQLPRFSPMISQLVLDEAMRGDSEAASRRLNALKNFPLVDATPAAFTLAARFIRAEGMPAKAKDDALHLALCAVHGLSYLLTWNFRHLANAELRLFLSGVCAKAGYILPTICTPDELI
jgi:predicted nucleic acid-binding protein